MKQVLKIIFLGISIGLLAAFFADKAIGDHSPEFEVDQNHFCFSPVADNRFLGVINNDLFACGFEYGPDKTISITSTGGMLFPALLLAERITATGTNTHTDGICYSACVNILVAGNHRTACAGSSFGIHQSNAPVGTWLLLDHFSRSDVVFDEISRIIHEAPSDKMLIFGTKDALFLGIIDEVVQC